MTLDKLWQLYRAKKEEIAGAMLEESELEDSLAKAYLETDLLARIVRKSSPRVREESQTAGKMDGLEYALQQTLRESLRSNPFSSHDEFLPYAFSMMVFVAENVFMKPNKRGFLAAYEELDKEKDPSNRDLLRQRLIVRNSYLAQQAARVIKPFVGPGPYTEDMINHGQIGLITAIDAWDGRHGWEGFLSHAIPSIFSHMIHAAEHYGYKQAGVSTASYTDLLSGSGTVSYMGLVERISGQAGNRLEMPRKD